MAYVDIDLFKAYARGQTVIDDSIYQWALDAGHTSVNDFCQRSFEVATGSATERSYVPDMGSDVIRFHDCVSVTSIIDYGTTLTAGTDFQLEPVNSLSWSSDARPYEQARRYSGCWTYDRGFARIDVTADWGWAAVPDAVVQATLIVSKDILQQRNNNSGVASFGEFGAVRVRRNPEALSLLAPLRRVEAFGFA